MGLLGSSNTDVLVSAVMDVGKNSYGMIYLEEDWKEVKDIYLNHEDTGGLITDAAVSQKDIKSHLDRMATKEDSPIKKVREDSSVYYMDLISMGRTQEGGLDTITPDIIEMFDTKAIIDKKSLAEEFGISMDDADFFIGKLLNKDYLKEIKAGIYSYYVIGDFLQGEYDITSLIEQLKRRATGGSINQSELSRVISVEAEEDVINYLETKEEVMLDLGGEFLILDDSCIDEFATNRANDVRDSIDSTLSMKGDILPVEELEGYVEEALESRQTSQYPESLAKAETLNMRDEIFEKTLEYLEVELGLRKKEGLYLRDEFEDTVERKAKKAVEEAEKEEPTSDTNWEELAMTKINKNNISSSPRVVNYFDNKAEVEIERIIDSKFGGDDG